MIIETAIDKQKARSLAKMAEMTLERLKTTDQDKYPANTLTDYYDTIHKLMEGLALLRGIKTKGEGAHQELIDYISKEEEMGEQKRQFLQELRDYRNRISYDGLNISKNYIHLNRQKIQEIIARLRSAIEKKTQDF